ncbi:hypothetical protein ACNS7O_09740 [Haloferacaceae archaeon DSL9]
MYVLHIDGESGNGVVRRNGIETADGHVGTGGVEQLSLADGLNYSDHAEVSIGEYLFYDRALAPSEVDEIEAHLSIKWTSDLS